MVLDPFAISFDLVGKQTSLRTMGAIIFLVKGCCFQAYPHLRILFSAGPEPDQGLALTVFLECGTLFSGSGSQCFIQR